MQLLDLPNELLEMIFSLLSRKDVGNVLLVCQQFRILAHSLAMKHSLTRLRVGSRGPYEKPRHRKPSDVLYSILLEPANRQYPKRLDFIGEYYKRCKSKVKHFQELYDLMVKSSIECPYIPPESRQTWMNAQKLQDASFAVLLKILPNLEEITIVKQWPGDYSIHAAKELLQESMVNKYSTALTKLQKVSYINDANLRLDDDIVTLFGSFPSLQSIYLRGLNDFRQNYIWQSPSQSPAEQLTLDYCLLSSASFLSIIRGFKRLRYLRYAQSLPEHNRVWDPSEFMQILLQNGHQSLEELDITSVDYPLMFPRWQFIGSLRDFPVLKHIIIDHFMLLDEGIPWRLVDILPASVESVMLRNQSPRPGCSLSWEVAEALFDGLPEEKAVMLPNLLSIHTEDLLDAELTSESEEVGITFTTGEFQSQPQRM